jgi:hypothetical protein
MVHLVPKTRIVGVQQTILTPISGPLGDFRANSSRDALSHKS